MLCPRCNKTIPDGSADIIALLASRCSCRPEHGITDPSRDPALSEGVDFQKPPAGIRYREDGRRVIATVAYRSYDLAFGALIAVLFWNGILSIFVLAALADTLRHLAIPIPTWLPTPELEGGRTGPAMTVFLWVFLTPFIWIGLKILGSFLLLLGGKTEVWMEHGHSRIFTGLGPVGRRWCFATSSVSSVWIDERGWTDEEGDFHRDRCITIKTHDGRPIRFGADLSGEQRKFVAAAIQRGIARRDQDRL